MRSKQIFLLILPVLLLVILAGCGGGTTNAGPTTPTYTFTPAATQLYVTKGQPVSFQLTPSASDTGATYAWNNNGTPAGTTANYSWTAPAANGTVNVSITITKGADITTNSWTIEVCDGLDLRVSARNATGQTVKEVYCFFSHKLSKNLLN